MEVWEIWIHTFQRSQVTTDVTLLTIHCLQNYKSKRFQTILHRVCCCCFVWYAYGLQCHVTCLKTKRQYYLDVKVGETESSFEKRAKMCNGWDFPPGLYVCKQKTITSA